MQCVLGDVIRGRKEFLHETKNHGKEEPSLMGWKKVYETPTRMIKEECQGFLQPKPGWRELQERPSCERISNLWMPSKLKTHMVKRKLIQRPYFSTQNNMLAGKGLTILAREIG